MTAEELRPENVSPLDDSGKSEDVYVGARVSPERRKTYDLAAVLGDFKDRSAFMIAACDRLSEEIIAARQPEGLRAAG